jgi:hypothetical protein
MAGVAATRFYSFLKEHWMRIGTTNSRNLTD